MRRRWLFIEPWTQTTHTHTHLHCAEWAWAGYLDSRIAPFNICKRHTIAAAVFRSLACSQANTPIAADQSRRIISLREAVCRASEWPMKNFSCTTNLMKKVLSGLRRWFMDVHTRLPSAAPTNVYILIVRITFLLVVMLQFLCIQLSLYWICKQDKTLDRDLECAFFITFLWAGEVQFWSYADPFSIADAQVA